MRLELESHPPIKLRFWYDTEPDGIRTTNCIVEEADDFISDGYSICDPRDNFERSVGRKIALRRALQEQDAGFRREVWHAYFKRIGAPFVK